MLESSTSEMSRSEGRARVLRGKVRQLLSVEPDTMECLFTTLASPAWRGLEAEILLARAGDRAIVFRHYYPEIGFYVDQDAAFEAANRAGILGISPAVLGTWPEIGLQAFDYLADPWRVGGLQDAYSWAIRQHIVDAKKVFQASEPLRKTADLFEEVIFLADRARACDTRLPKHLDFFLDFASHAGRKIKACGTDLVPCHRDGNTSNLMICGDSVRLLDFDLSANSDPFEDIGCYLMEMFDCEPEARTGFEQWYGSFDEGLFQRAMLYGIVDDLRWGLIAAILSKVSTRSTLEFSKYSAWRFLRLEIMSQTSVAADRIRSVA